MNILKAWASLEPESAEPIPVGLINETYRVKTASGLYILQKLHPIFAPAVNADILAVTDYLSKKKFVTPRLIKTDSGDLWALEDNQCWRMISYVEGHTFDQIKNPDLAYSAGRLVGRFHKALFDFEYDYRSIRSNVHDTPVYLERLERNLAQNPNHPYFERVSNIGHRLIKDARKIPNLWKLPARHSHGDLKISNVIFNSKQEAVCLIDLDTLGKMPWALEMGDAFRSWCNQQGENQSNSIFDQAIYEATLKGYQEETWDCWTKTEKESLIHGIKLVPLELCSRFLIDIFEDHYWKWDTEKFETRAEHNWVRAMSQWTLYEDILRKL
jgi:Ser/Thr protein kinase RdoA (MazF antagonist)